MKRNVLTLVAFVALFALTAPIVMADNNPPSVPTDPGGGGCSGPNCK